MQRQAVAVAFALSCAAVAELVNRTVTEPYLDEVFHIPQAARYCEAQWSSYDEKLTTPPGLYLASIAQHSVLPRWLFASSRLPDCASPAFLRSTNLLLLILLPQILMALRQSLLDRIAPKHQPPAYAQSRQDALRSIVTAEKPAAGALPALEAHAMACLPPLFFFGFLYYTDLGGVVMTLASLLYARRSSHAMAALTGLASLLFRQTNIVWLMFTLATSIVTLPGIQASPAAYTVAPALSTIHDLKALVTQPPLRIAALKLSLPYLPAFAAFASFIRWNGGIVLGDKSNHVATTHLAQVPYFCAFALFFGWPALLTQAQGLTPLLRRTAKSLFGSRAAVLRCALLLLLAAAAVHKGTQAHAFLLADNRHYTFYVWRRLINRTAWSRYLLVPVYVVSAQVWWDALAQSQSLLWLIGLALSTSLTLIPSPLIEPRYFLVPFLIMRLHLLQPAPDKAASGVEQTAEYTQKPRPYAWLGVAVELSWFTAINMVTLWLFLSRPFTWRSEPEALQRFMW